MKIWIILDIFISMKNVSRTHKMYFKQASGIGVWAEKRLLLATPGVNKCSFPQLESYSSTPSLCVIYPNLCMSISVN